MPRMLGMVGATFLVLLGAFELFVAFANLYNFEDPSRLGSAVAAAIGVALIAGGIWLMGRVGAPQDETVDNRLSVVRPNKRL